MTFNIHELDKLDSSSEEDEVVFEAYLDEFQQLFSSSPEGQQHFQKYSEVGNWTATFLDFAFRYLGHSFPTLKVAHVEEIITDIIPRKMSLRTREETFDAIPEWIALWTFLKREFQLKNAGPILDYLKTFPPEKFTRFMFDASKAGMAKSFFMQGQAAGYDMTDTAQLNEFMLSYNASIAKSLPASDPIHKILSGIGKHQSENDPDEALEIMTTTPEAPWAPDAGLSNPFYNPPSEAERTKAKASQIKEKKKLKTAKAARKRNKKR